VNRTRPILLGVILALGGLATTSPVAFAGVGPGPEVGPAVSRTPDAATARITFSAEVRANGAPLTLTGNGEVDLAEGAGEFEVTAPLLGTVELRLVDRELYLDLPLSLRPAAAGAHPWVALDLASRAKRPGEFGGTSWPAAFSAASLLTRLRTVSTAGFDERGAATVNGVATTAYAGEIDLAKLAGLAKDAAPSAAKALGSVEPQLAASVVPVEVWVDAGGRIRQITASLTPAGASTPALAVTIDLDDFGAPVSIAAPPAAETYLTTLAALATSTGLSGTQI
jgi:hypothetical protein